jgi:hypothetical protein
MKKNGLFVAMLALVLVFGTMLIGCDDGTTEEETEKTPEEKTVQERWFKWVDKETPCTLEYSVAEDGTNKITVGGTADTIWWKANAQYAYTAETGKKYKYMFEAWTEEGERRIGVQYYNHDSVTIGGGYQNLTTDPKIIEIVGQAIPVGGTRSIEFQCADKTGIFYVKIVSIEPITE